MMNPGQSPQTSVTAFVLAGGAGSRFGYRDKALLKWRGRPFLAHIAEQLRPQVDRIVVNSHNPAVRDSFSGPVIADLFPERRGPLAGILSGLNNCRTPFALFVPCDNPRVAPDLVQRLYAGLHTHHADIAYATTGNGDHYLHALIRTQLRDQLAFAMNNGQQAVRRWYAGQHCCRVKFDAQTECFANINTPQDLAQLPE